MTIDTRLVQRRLKNIRTLRTLPGVVKKVCLMAESDDISSAELGKMIGKDQVITARVLRLVNSSFYGFPNRISTITQALVLLGFTVVKGLLLGISIVEYMTESMVGLWEHSLGTAMAAGVIARQIGEPDPEEAQVAGLLHDLGKVVIALEFGDEFKAIQTVVEEESITFFEAERKILGNLTHLDINGFLCDEWNIPPRLCEAVTCYPKPARATVGRRTAAIVQLANALVRASDFGYAGDKLVPLIDQDCVRELGLDDDELQELIHTVVFELENMDVSELAG
ncbi:MAG: HDOD domain-containing protein [bacterium]|nr:HDOD domain-containing protein [bacterium]